METQSDVEIRNLNLEKSFLAHKVLDVFDQNPYFDNSYQKAVFILGILVRMVTKKQYESGLKNMPFYEKLDGLRLNPRSIQKIFPDAIAKLIEYKANKLEAPALETLASRYFMQTSSYPSNEEISFTFAMGLSYGNAIWTGYKKIIDKEEDE